MSDESIPTINVIVFEDKQPIELASFPDTEKGNKKAEELFERIANHLNNKTLADPISKEDMEDYTENGYFEICKGKDYVIIFHSTYIEGEI